MKAAEHTERMIQGWAQVEIRRADLAVRRKDEAMLWQRDLPLDGLPLGWARAENAHGSEVYIRPARGYDWPLLFLDDLPVPIARQLAVEHGAMVVQTSQAGGCHVWLPCDRDLNEESRCEAQRGLAVRLGADQASISGEHLGRLAGFKNWKRGGCWVNVLCELEASRRFPVPSTDCRALPAPKPSPTASRPALDSLPTRNGGGDASASGMEWGWVCRLLETGQAPARVYQLLVKRAAGRRGEDTERYARRTVERALARIQGASNGGR
jgi:hypothetical protein